MVPTYSVILKGIMEVIKLNPILKFHENHLQNVRKALGYEDINRLRQDIEQLDDWIKKQSHFKIKDFDRDYLERLLIYNKGSIERAKKKFDKLCTCTNLMPEFLKGFDVKNEFAPLFKVYTTCLLPTPTEDNYRVVLVVATGEEDENFEVIMFYRYLIVIGHYLLTHDYCQGFEIVADIRKVTSKTVKKSNPMVVHRALTLLTECMGHRLKRIHFFNESKFFEVMLFIIKQGLSSKLKDRVVIHSSNEDLYKYIPREMLAKEFGGDDISVKDLNDIQLKELSSDANIAKLKLMEEAATDENYRLPCTFNEEYSGVPGSFKTLCVD